MANNPFYPGYAPGKPKEDPVGPLYPGYFAGQALPRRPASKNFIKPIEYDVDAYMQNIDDAARKVLLSPIAGPRWVVERILDDWKENLKVSIKPKDVIEIAELDDYSTEDFPGAVISLSLNPADWKKDPKKQALKTAKDWVKQATGLDFNDITDSDFSDIVNKTNQKATQELFWKKGTDTMAEKAGEAMEGRMVAEGGLRSSRSSSPMNLRGVSVRGTDPDTGYPVTYKNNYQDAVLAMGNFVNQWDNPKERESKRNDYIYETAKAVNREVRTRINNPTYKPFQDKYEGALGMFNIKVGLLDDINNPGGLSKGIKNATEKLEKSILGQKSEVTGKPLTPSAAWTELDNALIKADKSRRAKLNQVKGLFSRGKIDEATYSKFVRNQGDYENKIKGLKEVVRGANTSSTASVKEQEAGLGAIRKVTGGGVAGKTLTGGGTWTNSISGILAGDLKAQMVNPSLGGIGALIADDSARTAGLDFHARKIIPAINRFERERVRHATKEVLTAWDSEKILERYVWNRFKKVLPAWTGGKFIEDKLKEINYGGLKITEEGTPSWRDPKKLARFEKKYAYKVKMKLDPARYGVSKVVLTGGNHFRIIENNLYKKFSLSNPSDVGLLQNVFDGTHNKDALARKLFGCSYAQMLVDKKKTKQYKDFLRQSKGYKEWLKAQKKTFGKDRVKDSAFATMLLGDLTAKNASLNGNYKLTKKYIGRLEKVHNTFLTLQKKWEASVFGKSIKFFQQWKTIISEKVGEIFAKLISKLFGAAAAASGVGAFLTAVVEFVVKKTLEYSEAWIKAIIKWDFEDFSKMVNKDLTKLLKSCLIVFTVIVVINAIPMWLLFGIIGSSISPVDPTVGNSSFGYGRNPPGENDVLKVRKEVKITLNDGTIATDITQIPNDKAVGAVVQYTIKISPRITITDGSVSYADAASIMSKENPRVFLTTPYQSLKEFKEGKGIVIPLPSRSIIAADKDSLLMNTVSVDTPAVPAEGIEADSVSWSIYTRIGNYVPDCPLGGAASGFYVLTASYNKAIPGSHGTDAYWKNICGSSDCRSYAIPWSWYKYDCESFKSAPGCNPGPYYGYAMDVASNDTSSLNPVSLPPLGKADRTWTIKAKYTSNPGYNGILALSDDGKWQIYYVHLNEADVQNISVGSSVKAGEIIASLSSETPGTSHVHIELIDMSGGGNGVPVKPECYLCSNNPQGCN